MLHISETFKGPGCPFCLPVLADTSSPSCLCSELGPFTQSTYFSFSMNFSSAVFFCLVILKWLYIFYYYYYYCFTSYFRRSRRMCVFVCVSRSVVSDSLWPRGLLPTRLLHPWDFPGKSTGVGCHPLLQWIFLTLGSNLGLLHCRQIPYGLSHQGSLLL